jgi:hypothetical protein
VEPFICVSPT